MSLFRPNIEHLAAYVPGEQPQEPHLRPHGRRAVRSQVLRLLAIPRRRNEIVLEVVPVVVEVHEQVEQHVLHDLDVGAAGRAQSTANLLLFATAWALQWGIGAVLDRFRSAIDGTVEPAGYHWAFGLVLALQVVAVLWYLHPKRGS